MKRPIAGFALFFAMGIAMARVLPLSLLPLLAASAVALPLFVRLRLAAVVPAAAALLSAAIRMAFVSPVPVPSLLRLEGKSVHLEGRVGGEVKRALPSRSSFLLKDVILPEGETGRGLREDLRATVAGERDIALAYGDRVEMRGILRRIRGPTNPGQFDARAHWERRGIGFSVVARAGDVRVLSRGHGIPLVAACLSLRKTLQRRLLAGMPRAEGSFLSAALLGLREEMGERDKLPLRRTGTLHVLAVSGLHVGLLYLFLSFTARLLGLSTKGAAALLIPLLIGYVFLTGARTPVVRAAAMLVLWTAAPLFRREGDPLTIVAFVALMILLFRPLRLFDPSFQLSFAAVLSLILLTPAAVRSLRPLFRLDRDPASPEPKPGGVLWLSFRKWFLWLAAGSLSVWCGLLPLMARSFFIVSPVALLANLWVIPLMTPVLVLGFLSMLTGLFLPLLSLCFNACNSLFIRLLTGGVRLLSGLPFGSFNTPPPAPGLLALYYSLLFLPLLRRTKFPLFAMAPLLFLLWTLWAKRPPEALEITVLDVGQGDAIVLRTPGRRTVLVDAGQGCTPWSGFDAGRSVVLPFLRSAGVDRLHLLVSTHPDGDHLGGVPSVLEGMAVRRILDSGVPKSTALYRRYLRAVREKGIPRLPAKRGLSMDWGGARAVVLSHGAEGPFDKANDNSVVIRVTRGACSALLTGDIERRVEASLRDASLQGAGLPLRSSVLKVPHHGSRTSSSTAFLDAVRPRVACVSVGRNNRFGHPAGEVLSRYRERGVRVFRTDRDGAVSVTLDGEAARVRTFLPPPGGAKRNPPAGVER